MLLFLIKPGMSFSEIILKTAHYFTSNKRTTTYLLPHFYCVCRLYPDVHPATPPESFPNYTAICQPRPLRCQMEDKNFAR